MSELLAYQTFCKAICIHPQERQNDLVEYSDMTKLANSSEGSKLTAALQAFIECVAGEEHAVNRVDRVFIDLLIAKIDQVLGFQLDEILHHPEFQELEALWRGLDYLVSRTDFRANTKIEILNVSKEALEEDFNDATDLLNSGLYKQSYEKEYDTPGGEPITAMISNYKFNAGNQDITLLTNIAKVAAATHCPFIGNIESEFFGKKSFEEVAQINELANYMDRSEYIRWNSFRDSEDARYIGLTCPRFLLRMPYGKENPVRTFCYKEAVFTHAGQYLWGAASFAFAANMTKSFRDYGWVVNIRGPESGGKVEHLPLPQYDLGNGLFSKIPTEIIISETRELELANLGFIPLSYYKNSDFACFFSANSAQKPTIYLSTDATANSRINARLPYVFLSARIAHYLKVLQRETIGSNVTKQDLEERLNNWLKTLVTKMSNPDPEQISHHPLRDGRVEVSELDDNPGFYRVVLYAMPHFQIEGIDVSLSIVGKMPKNKSRGE